MELFAITFCVTSLAAAAMGVGLFFGRSISRGGCASLDGIGDGSLRCAGCPRPCPRSRREDVAEDRP